MAWNSNSNLWDPPSAGGGDGTVNPVGGPFQVGEIPEFANVEGTEITGSGILASDIEDSNLGGSGNIGVDSLIFSVNLGLSTFNLRAIGTAAANQLRLDYTVAVGDEATVTLAGEGAEDKAPLVQIVRSLHQRQSMVSGQVYFSSDGLVDPDQAMLIDSDVQDINFVVSLNGVTFIKPHVHMTRSNGRFYWTYSIFEATI